METAVAPRVQALADTGVPHLPAQYSQLPDLRPDPSHRGTPLSVPVVDLSATAAACVDAVSRACGEWGAFHVVNHGVPPGLLAAMRDAGLAFFRVPMEDKLRFGCDPAKGAAAEVYESCMLANVAALLHPSSSSRRQRTLPCPGDEATAPPIPRPSSAPSAAAPGAAAPSSSCLSGRGRHRRRHPPDATRRPVPEAPLKDGADLTLHLLEPLRRGSD